MQVFQTKKQLKEYYQEKRRELLAHGIRAYGIIFDYHGATILCQDIDTKENYISVLLYSKHIGKGIVKDIQEYRDCKIITMTSCGIADYLKKHNIPHRVIEN